MQITVNGIATKYTLHGKNVVHMTQGSNDLHFFYDAANKPAVVVYNGTAYAYVKNLQGDIIAILDQSGNVVVQYTYDAWGKLISTTGSMASTLGEINPFRYRGYVYDEETGLYYLQSRYYNPGWCRFVNSDVLVGKRRLLAHNMFVYCRNMVICYTDPDGLEDNGIWPLRKKPVWGEAVDGQKMPVWYLVAGLHVMVEERWSYSSSMDYGKVDCIGGARFIGQQFFKNNTILNKNIRQKVSSIRANNLSRLETINPQNLEEIPYGAFLFTAPNKEKKRHMGYYIGSYNGYDHCIIETTGKGDVMHYADLEERLRDDEKGTGFIEWGLWNCVDYDAVDIPESVPAFEFMF